MQFGICTGPENLGAAEAAGFDYAEFGLAGNLAPLADDAAVLPALEKALGATSLRVEALNGMVPADVRLVGPERDAARIRHYLQRASGRAAWIGADTVVFGSGGARRVPDGFARDAAEEQIAAFLQEAGDIFGANDITIAIEPLNTSECNILTSVAEACAMAARVGHPRVCVLSDLYHVGREGQRYAETAAAGSVLAHVHVARPTDRRAPAEADLALMTAYFAAVHQAGYDRRVSIEGLWQETPDQAGDALRVLHTAWEQSR